jgi:hypothetical protein
MTKLDLAAYMLAFVVDSWIVLNYVQRQRRRAAERAEVSRHPGT